jgi:HK97 family phage prohead protease
MFGEYTETVDRSALSKSLANGPDVAWLTNHRGVTMARTTNGTLELKVKTNEDGYQGLYSDAYLNPDRQDVRDIVSAIVDGLVDEMSFGFMLNDGVWNDDYTEFRITEADINRGDVSAVNYGANPFTSIQARTADVLEDLNRIPTVALVRAQQIIAERTVSGAGLDLSKRSSERYQRAVTNLERIIREVGHDSFDLSDIADWDIVDETGEDDETPESEDKSDEERSAREVPNADSGIPVYLWETRLKSLKEH